MTSIPGYGGNKGFARMAAQQRLDELKRQKEAEEAAQKASLTQVDYDEFASDQVPAGYAGRRLLQRQRNELEAKKAEAAANAPPRRTAKDKLDWAADYEKQARAREEKAQQRDLFLGASLTGDDHARETLVLSNPREGIGAQNYIVAGYGGHVPRMDDPDAVGGTFGKLRRRQHDDLMREQTQRGTLGSRGGSGGMALGETMSATQEQREDRAAARAGEGVYISEGAADPQSWIKQGQAIAERKAARDEVRPDATAPIAGYSGGAPRARSGNSANSDDPYAIQTQLDYQDPGALPQVTFSDALAEQTRYSGGYTGHRPLVKRPENNGSADGAPVDAMPERDTFKPARIAGYSGHQPFAGLDSEPGVSANQLTHMSLHQSTKVHEKNRQKVDGIQGDFHKRMW